MEVFRIGVPVALAIARHKLEKLPSSDRIYIELIFFVAIQFDVLEVHNMFFRIVEISSVKKARCSSFALSVHPT